jgi:hypothetical protein
VTFPAFRKSCHAEPRSTESQIVRLRADSAAEAEKAAEAIATGGGQRNPISLAIDDRACGARLRSLVPTDVVDRREVQ